MSEPQFGVDWLRARVFWRVERLIAELSASTALDAASRQLQKAHANVEGGVGNAALKFGYELRAGRSWLAGIWGGTVEAVENDDRLVVTVGASPLPLGLHALLGALVVQVSGLGTAWLIGVVGLLLGGNYLFVHFGLWRVADAVARASPAALAVRETIR